jgi:sulfatase modifying factor 1
MRLRYLVLLVVVLVAGCLVPRYDIDPLATATGGQANAAGTASAGSATSADAGATSAAAGATAADCGPDQKFCADKCVDIDDVNYGCTATSCNMSTCPAAGSATLACEAGACVIGACGAGSKKCAGKCVAISDPTYGCGDTSCDASSCPDPKSGTLICDGGACSVGACEAGTKQCGNKCVPQDENNGCGDPKDCAACASSETCLGTPSACTCKSDDVEACKNQWCGTAVNNCGETVDCQNYCRDATPACFNNACVECNVATECPGPGDNACAVPTCINQKCGYTTVEKGTVCPGGHCSTSVPGICVRPPVSAGGVSIDATEVTRGEYYQFAKVKSGGASGLPSSCSWWGVALGPEPAMKDYDYPVGDADWCSAYAYCQWAGRRLCGKIGGGAVAAYGDQADPTKSQWVHACEGPSSFAYPYGEDYVDNRCNGPHAQSAVSAVATHPQCVGGYPGLYDMSGNVAEWLDSCDGTTANAQCAIQGGDFSQLVIPAQMSLRCDSTFYGVRSSASAGFRCCGP